MIEDLHHIQLAIPKGSEEDARKFYGGVLGLSEVEKPRELRGRGGVWFQKGLLRLHLGIEDPFRPAKKAHPGFRVASLATAIPQLQAAGVVYQSDIDLPGIARVYVNDPFGNRIELLELRTA